MKINNNIIAYVKQQLATSPAWVSRAIVVLHQRQTVDEQASQMTRNVNGAGFNSTDAFILSSFAEQINKGRTLSPKQLAIAHKKVVKYAKQVISLIPAEKLAEIEAKATLAVAA